MIGDGARVQIIDPGDRCYGQYGTVVEAEHPAPLTKRPAVIVRLDGQTWQYDERYYLAQVDEVAHLRVVA